MTFSRLPESVMEALDLRAGVRANVASSMSLWDDRVRVDMLQNILPFIVSSAPFAEACEGAVTVTVLGPAVAAISGVFLQKFGSRGSALEAPGRVDCLCLVESNALTR
jgi:hypothetical protein